MPEKGLMNVALPVHYPRPQGTRELRRRWDPFPEMEGLYEHLGEFMQNLTGDLPMVSPAADVEETDDAFLIELDLPGVKAEDLTVEVRDNRLRVTGEIKERERVGILRRRSRPVGAFDYLISVPGEVDPETVEASLHEGVLTVRLGKAAKTQPRKIEVKGS